MLREETAALLKRWNYPFESLYGWTFKGDPWCDDVAVEAYLGNALFVIYQIAEVGMGKYYGRVAVLFDHEHPTLFLACKEGVVLFPNIRPVVTPDGRYMFACFYYGVLIIDLMKRKFTGLKLDHYEDSVCYDMQPSGDTFHIYHKENGKSSVIIPERLTWHEGPGEQENIETYFQPF